MPERSGILQTGVIGMPEKNTHDGHRRRMREKFIENGRQSLAEHEFLEMLLYYVVPRRNTNELAHDLLRRFGSLSGIMDADVSELADAGLTQNAAVFFKLLKEAGRSYYLERDKKPRFITIGDAATHITRLLYGEKSEQLYIFLLDMRMQLVMQKKLAEGSIDSVTLDSRALLRTVLSSNAAYAILAHNHPTGSPSPTRSDVSLTRTVMELLKGVGVKLCDHIIVAGDGFYSFNQGKGMEHLVSDSGDNLTAHQYADISR